MKQTNPELSFLLRHPKYAWAALSNYASFSSAQLHKYANNLHWLNVTFNRNINIDEDFIQDYLQFIPFANQELSGGSIEFNERIAWSVELLNRYYSHWNWECLAQNQNVVTNPLILAAFMNEFAPHYLEQNNGTESNADPYVQRLRERLRMVNLELENTLTWEDFYTKPKKLWKIVSSSEKLPWTIDRLEHHKFELSWDILSNNTSLPWSEQLIRRYEKRWYWGSNEGDGLGLQFNFEIPWNASLLRDYSDRILSYPLSYNTNVDWNIDMLIEFENWWDFENLDSNSALWEKVFEGKIGDLEDLLWLLEKDF